MVAGAVPWSPAVVAVGLPEPETDADEARRLAVEILAGDAYRDRRSVLERAEDWLADLLGDLFRTLGGTGAGSVVAWVILLAALAFLVAATVRILPAFASGGVTREARVETAAGAMADGRSGEAWRAEADRLEAAGLLDEALRARYRALLVDLVARGWLDDVPGRTPGEYRRELATVAPAAGPAFTALTDRFEAVWYGPAAASPADLAAFRDGDVAVLDAVARPADLVGEGRR